jgi:cytochrome c oxidase assembly factor CtaG
VGAFGAGLGAVALALASPLHAAGESLLLAHMVQHLLLTTVGAPLIVMGSPVVVMSQGLPRRAREAVHRWGRRSAVASVGRVCATPVVAWSLAVGTIWAWHVPSMYQAALANGLVHRGEHLSFLASWLLFWWMALAPAGRRHVARGIDTLFVVTGGLASGVVGALLALGPIPLYPWYLSTASTWGLSAVQDQHLAGAVMWVGTAMVHLAVAAWLFVQWVQASEREVRRLESRVPS